MAKQCVMPRMPSCKGKLRYMVVSPTGKVVALACTWKDAVKKADKYEVGHYVYHIEKIKS